MDFITYARSKKYTNQAVAIGGNPEETKELIAEEVSKVVTTIEGPKGDTGPAGPQGPKGEDGDDFTYEDFTPEQLASLKGEKGDRGLQGEPGKDGQPGYTPQKGIDYFDGTNGITPNLTIGTVETLPSGNNATAIITGDKENPILNLRIPKGANGYTPVKGTDYWTDTDVSEIKSYCQNYIDIQILGGES